MMLNEESVIDKDKFPRAFNELEANKFDKPGFDLIIQIVFALSPYLGGISTPLDILMKTIDRIRFNISEFLLYSSAIMCVLTSWIIS